MSERFSLREVREDPDLQQIGSFAGLSSASYQVTGDVLFAHRLINARITDRNEVVTRRGTRITTYLANQASAEANNVSIYRFTFDNINYAVTKSGTSVFLDLYRADGTTTHFIVKTGVFSARASSEKATFSTVIEGNTCYVLMATPSDTLRVLTILRRDLALTTATGSSLVGTINNYPNANILNNNNTFVINENNAHIPTSTISQTTFTLTITTASPHGLTTASIPRVHSVFWQTTRPANYYPGNYLYQPVIRRNVVSFVDTTVRVPVELYSNPLISEPKEQRLDIDTLICYSTSSATASLFPRVFTRQPTVANQWDFADGNTYLGGNPNVFTVRTPAFVQFGALQTTTPANSPQPILMFRSRDIVLVPGASIPISDIKAYVDRVLNTPAYQDSAGTVIVSGVPTYFTYARANSPGINTSAVVELIHQSTGTELDLTPSGATVVVGDGFTIPLYGYGDIANVRTLRFPNKVITVGNRVLLSGLDNRVHFSNSNWTYRGISWNNFQVSSINFSSSSAFSIAVGQESSRVISIASVNGVIIVATDNGIFRLSGDSANQPPSATNTNIGRVASEVMSSVDSLLIINNKVLYASSNGLFQLEYSRDNEEITPTPMSTAVTDFFSQPVDVLMYSPTYRALILSFLNTNSLLFYSMESETWSEFKFAFQARPILCQSFDGVAFAFPRNDNANFNMHQTVWDMSYTSDLQNTALIAPNTSILSRTATVTTTPTDVSTLVTPTEMLSNLNANVRMAFGSNHAVVDSGSAVVNEYAGGSIAAPIRAFLVTKDYFGNKLIRASRVRNLVLILTGTGTLTSRLLLSDDFRAAEYDVTIVNPSGQVQPGAEFASRTVTGDTASVRLRFMGSSEYWAVGVELDTNLRLLGWQFDTSVKKRGRLV